MKKKTIIIILIIMLYATKVLTVINLLFYDGVFKSMVRIQITCVDYFKNGH